MRCVSTSNVLMDAYGWLAGGGGKYGEGCVGRERFCLTSTAGITKVIRVEPLSGKIGIFSLGCAR